MKKFDINIDIGEGFEIEKDLMPLIQSCNIACGGHAGSTNEIKKCVALAKKYGVKIGAHPSYPDKKNFGRNLFSLLRQNASDAENGAGLDLINTHFYYFQLNLQQTSGLNL